MNGIFPGELLQPVEGNPPHFVGLHADSQGFGLRCHEKETYIVVKMAGDLVGAGNIVYIHIEDTAAQRPCNFEARLLSQLPFCHAKQMRVTIGMSPGLNPFAEPAVMNEKGFVEVLVHDPGRTGKVGREVVMIEACTRRGQEVDKTSNRFLLCGKTNEIGV
jgi:hypothetical protein